MAAASIHFGNPNHAAIRIRAGQSWPSDHGTEAPHIPMTPAEKAELSRIGQVIDYHTSGSLLFSQGEDALYYYLLTDGIVETYFSLRNGERQILAFHWPGDLIGLSELGRYVGSAATVAPSRLYRFSVGELSRSLRANPEIQNGFLVKAIHDLRNAQRQLIVMGRLDITHRLAAFLLDCSAHEHYYDANTNLLTLAMTRFDIADYLGTSAETVTRAMGQLQRNGLIKRLRPRDIKIDRPGLRAFVDLE